MVGNHSQPLRLIHAARQTAVGLCHFHDDHEPSLVVDTKKQLWNCLGTCHEGGGRVPLCDEGGTALTSVKRTGGLVVMKRSRSVMVEDQQWLERAVEHYHARLLETP